MAQRRKLKLPEIASEESYAFHVVQFWTALWILKRFTRDNFPVKVLFDPEIFQQK